jgi:hypothetical protein
MFKRTRLAGVRLCGALICSTVGFSALAQADAVTDWNAITMDAVTSARPGPQGMLDVALVHIAVHDAVQAIEKRYEPYHFQLKNAKGSRSAATAAAAHGVLVSIYPTQAITLDAAYHNYLAQHGLSGDPGLEVGEQAAANIAPLRRATPTQAAPPFVGSTEIGKWRPTESFIGAPPAPPSFSPMVTPWLAKSEPFTLTSPARFRAGPPPELTSARYWHDFEEVKQMGALNNSARTAAQTDLAYFYNDNFFTQWNRVLRTVAQKRINRIGDSARLFALANMAGADALITAWDSKVTYVFWRPITAIREAANDGNPFTVADPTWQPLVNTPNYPDYTSGANSIVAAMTSTLAMFFGSDRVPFEVTSNHPLAVQKTRVYARFSDAADDLVEARIYLGIHFRFADVAARRQGEKVADHAFDHFLQPVERWNRWEH